MKEEENIRAHLAFPYSSVRPTDYLETLQMAYLSSLIKCSNENKAREHDPLESTMATHIKSLFSKNLDYKNFHEKIWIERMKQNMKDKHIIKKFSVQT